jgi:sulfonate transport system substrate-binding protein
MERLPVYYTRCPVPTASGIAFQRGMFKETFAGSAYQVRNIVELGAERQNVHYTHEIDAFFREGGGSPPVWARARGVDSVILGMTFVDEMMGLFVRHDDPAQNIGDLVGRRIALPVWPRLIFNFWRYVALHGVLTTLGLVELGADDVRFVDVTEGWDPNERRNVSRGAASTPGRCEYRNQLSALLDGKVDVVFGKGPEAALLVLESCGQIRLLHDLRTVTDPATNLSIAMPRLLTTSRRFVTDHRGAVVDYVRTLVRAARWADQAPAAAAACVADECGVDSSSMGTYVGPEFLGRYMPRLTPDMTQSLQVMIDFMHRHDFIEQAFSGAGWIDASPLEEAVELERPRD